MTRARYAAGALFALLFAAGAPAMSQAIDCTGSEGYVTAQAPRPNAAQSELLPGPRVYLQSVRRGFLDHRGTACADTAVISLVIDPRDVSPTDIYSFELVEGSLPAGVLPESFVRPVELESGVTGFSFSWLDLNPATQELAAIDALVRINRISYAGIRSTPMLLRIESAGGPVASPAVSVQFWTGTALWLAAAVVLFVFFGLRMKAFRSKSRRADQLAAIQERLRSLAKEKR